MILATLIASLTFTFSPPLPLAPPALSPTHAIMIGPVHERDRHLLCYLGHYGQPSGCVKGHFGHHK